MTAVWYFAYGSNLSPEVFRGRRGIEPRRALAGRLEGWRLVFDKPPLFDVGESYANLAEDPAHAAFGVLYEISVEDLAHVELTEGVPIDNYRSIMVQVTPLAAAGAAVAARTLVSDRRDPSLCPSDRYMGQVIAGALAHGLPASHLEFLRSVPCRPSTPAADDLRRRLEPFMRRA